MIDYDEIRKQVAMEHNFLIAKDDPLLASVTLNELVFQRYVEILLEKQREHMKALEAAQQKGLAEAKITAGRVITDASNYASDQAGERVRVVMNDVLVQIKKELAVTRLEIQAYRKIAVAAAVVSCFCGVALVSAVINIF